MTLTLILLYLASIADYMKCFMSVFCVLGGFILAIAHLITTKQWCKESEFIAKLKKLVKPFFFVWIFSAFITILMPTPEFLYTLAKSNHDNVIYFK